MTVDSIDMCALFNKKSVMNEAQRNSITDGGRRLYEQGTFYCVWNIASFANATSLLGSFQKCGCLFLGSCNPQHALFSLFGWGGVCSQLPLGAFLRHNLNLYDQYDNFKTILVLWN
jgi:hypothetical protein